MPFERKKKSRKEVFAENLRELIHTNPSLSALILLSLLLIPWSVGDFVSPALRFGLLVVAPQIWKGAVAWLTQPVLFVLLNLVVMCIWISSGSAAHANEEVTLPQKKKLSNSSRGGTLRIEFGDANRENSARELQSKKKMNKTPWEAFFEQKSPPWTPPPHLHASMKSSSNEESEYGDRPESSSRVIVRDVSVNSERGESSSQNALVIEKDELNERIEAFFARFREQLRQDSLRRN